ncbi:hypothetical protein [Gemmatimonas sp.]|jgi:hypothetical protein|uniref:hypothetical protein n=1 Tax=Gemmatimonas sp. TaxID=1962908 RepID=UPI0022C90061|nr:hypothetical protein [Gemmatimonas sp.]MCZ8205970.1 hypothetical protein [Gemmatimonas sp.]
MMTRRNRAPVSRCRRGFVLPLVIAALAVSSLLALAFIHEALLGARGARASLGAADVEYRAEAALGTALARWSQDSLWNTGVGTRHQFSVPSAGQPVAVEWLRLHPLMLILRAQSHGHAVRRLDVSSRDLLRAVRLEPPPFPIEAAISTAGTLHGSTGTIVSGIDELRPHSPCGADRDTASLPPVVANRVAAVAPHTWTSPPPWRPPPATLWMRTHGAVQALGPQVPVRHWNATPRPLPPSRGWNGVIVRGPSIAITGPSAWQGLLVLDGNATVTGALHVTGVLVVLGNLDAAAAQLTVQGAVVAADTTAGGVTLGTAGAVRYDRCAVQLALAVGARPSLAPFSLWHRLSR